MTPRRLAAAVLAAIALTGASAVAAVLETRGASVGERWAAAPALADRLS